MSFPLPTPKQARLLWMSVTALAVSVFLALLGLLAWGLGWIINVLAPIIWPLAIAGILACLLDPMVAFFVRRKVPRTRAILLVFIICLAGVLAVLAQIVPRMVVETQQFIEHVPSYSTNLQQRINRWVSRTPLLVQWKEQLLPTSDASNASSNTPAPLFATNAISPVPNTTGAAAANPAPGSASAPPAKSEHSMAARFTQAALQWFTAILPELGQWLLQRLKTVASWAGMIVGLALVPIFVFYLLLEKHGIEGSWTDYLPVQESKFKEELIFVLKAINEYLIAFFRGQIVVALCIGFLLTLGFLAIGLDYAVLLGVLAGVLSIIPYLGAVLTIIPSVLLASIQFKDWFHPVLVVVIFVVVQALEGLVISPRIMGERVGLHPMTIIIAVLVGTTMLGGVLGGVLAIPLTAALRVLMFRYVWKKPMR